MPQYIKEIEDSPLFQYEKTMAINRCMADYAHIDETSRGKLCLDKLGYYIVTQPHMTRAMKMEQGTGGALGAEGFKYKSKKGGMTMIFILLTLAVVIIAVLLMKLK